MSGTLTSTPDQPRPDLLLSLPALRARLEEQRQFRVEQIDALAGGDPGQSPAGPEGTADAAHSQVTAALLAGARQALTDIDTALYRINNGEYGKCLECRAPIDMQRLRTLPQTALCADCHRARASHPDRGTGSDPIRGEDAPPVVA
jgi:RNA polymerase-binding transcription factor DksA